MRQYKFLSTAILLLLTLPGLKATATVACDTVEVKTHLDSVIVIADGNNTLINYKKGPYKEVFTFHPMVSNSSHKGKSWKMKASLDSPFDYHSSNYGESRYGTVIGSGLYAGAVIPTDASDGLSTGWEIGINQIIGGYWEPKAHCTRFSIGIGMGYSQVNVRHGSYPLRDGDRLTINPIEEPVISGSGRIRSMIVTVPLLMRQPLVGRFSLMLGGIARFNTYTTAISRITASDNINHSYTFKGLNQRPLTIDLMGGLGWTNCLGVYVRYSPMSVWRNAYGPKHHAVSVGGMLNF